MLEGQDESTAAQECSAQCVSKCHLHSGHVSALQLVMVAAYCIVGCALCAQHVCICI